MPKGQAPAPPARYKDVEPRATGSLPGAPPCAPPGLSHRQTDVEPNGPGSDPSIPLTCCATPGKPLPYLPEPVSLVRSGLRIRTRVPMLVTACFPQSGPKVPRAPALCLLPSPADAASGDRPGPGLSRVSTRHTGAGPGNEPEPGTSQPAVPARHFLVLAEVALESVTDHRPSSASGLSAFLPALPLSHSAGEDTEARSISEPTHSQDGARI